VWKSRGVPYLSAHPGPSTPCKQNRKMYFYHCCRCFSSFHIVSADPFSQKDVLTLKFLYCSVADLNLKFQMPPLLWPLVRVMSVFYHDPGYVPAGIQFHYQSLNIKQRYVKLGFQEISRPIFALRKGNRMYSMIRNAIIPVPQRCLLELPHNL
jgi:hypothetical protein